MYTNFLTKYHPDNTGRTDVSNKLQEAINNERFLYIPAGIYRLDKTVQINKPISIKGDFPIYNVNKKKEGTWLHFNHNRKGIEHNALRSGTIWGIELKDLGFFRNQPTPRANWQPNDADYDLYLFGVSDTYLSRLFFLNATKGIKVTSKLPIAASGRVFIDDVKGHFFKEGINIESAYDVCRISDFHAWPFWADNRYVHEYTLNHLKAIRTGRNDNPMFENIFTIFAHTGLEFYNAPEGITSKLKLSNIDFDRGTIGIHVNNVNYVTCMATAISTQCEVEYGNGKYVQNGLRIDGDYNSLQLTSFEPRLTRNAILVNGNSNQLYLASYRSVAFDYYHEGYAEVQLNGKYNDVRASGSLIQVVEKH